MSADAGYFSRLRGRSAPDWRRARGLTRPASDEGAADADPGLREVHTEIESPGRPAAPADSRPRSAPHSPSLPDAEGPDDAPVSSDQAARPIEQGRVAPGFAALDVGPVEDARRPPDGDSAEARLDSPDDHPEAGAVTHTLVKSPAADTGPPPAVSSEDAPRDDAGEPRVVTETRLSGGLRGARAGAPAAATPAGAPAETSGEFRPRQRSPVPEPEREADRGPPAPDRAGHQPSSASFDQGARRYEPLVEAAGPRSGRRAPVQVRIGSINLSVRAPELPARGAQPADKRPTGARRSGGGQGSGNRLSRYYWRGW